MYEAYRAGGAEERNQRGLDHILVDTNTPYLLVATGCCAVDVCNSLDITAKTDGVLLIVADVQVDAQRRQSGSQGGDSTSADTGDGMLDVIDLNNTSEATLEVLSVEGLARLRRSRGLRAVGGNAVVDQVEARVGLEVVSLLEQVDDLAGLQLPADCL